MMTDSVYSGCISRTNPSRTGRLYLIVLALLVLTVWSTKTAQAQSTREQLVSIKSPSFNQTFTQGDVSVAIHFYDGADTRSWEAHVNGTDIRGFFPSPAGCSAPCDATASVPSNLLIAGGNVITTSVAGVDSSADTDRVEFIYEAVSNQAATMRTAGVAVNAAYLPVNADSSKVASFQILVGPGPGFARRVYDASELICSAGTNSFELLVLDAQTLEPTGDGTKGQGCFGTASELTAFLQSVPAGRLIIGNTFYGEMPNLDTSLIGGTNFATSPASHRCYSIIGVTGAAAGQAYQSYGALYFSNDYIRPLIGSLMLDYAQRYVYVPSEFAEFELLPNRISQGSTTSGSTIVIGSTNYQSTLQSGDVGGFFLVEVDRKSGRVQYQKTFPTNGPRSDQGISQLATELNTASQSLLLFMTSIGQPFASTSSVPTSLADAITGLGGVRYILPRLGTQTSKGQVPTYSLVSSTNAAYISDPARVLEESNAFIYSPSSGAVQGILERDRFYQLSLGDASPETYVNTGTYTKVSNYGWKTVGLQQMQDWPTWTAEQQQVYADLTDSNAYPRVRQALGCASSACQHIRNFYSSYLGSGTPPSGRIDYNDLVYVAGRGYTESDFNTVVAQLREEQAYLANVQLIYGQFAETWNSTETTIQVQLASVAGSLEQDLRERSGQQALAESYITQGAALASAGGFIPGVGIGLSALSGTIRAMSIFAQQDTLIPQEYTLRLDSLINDSKELGLVLSNTNSAFFVGIVNDWGKLQTIGQGYAAGNPPWFMCANCTQSQPPRTSIPLVALGAKKGYYRELLPLVYSIDEFLNSPASSPQQIGGLRGGGYKWCEGTYQDVGTGYLNYPSINPYSTNDFYILTQTIRGHIDSSGRVINRFAPDSLLQNLFGAPAVSAGGVLTGGAGLPFDKFSSGSGRPLDYRAGYIPGDFCIAPTSASPDFTIAPTGPTAWTTNGGSTVSGSLFLQETEGFQGVVTLSCSGLVQGDFCTFSPATADLTTTKEGSFVSLAITTAPRASTASGLRKEPARNSDGSSGGLAVLAGVLIPAIAFAKRNKTWTDLRYGLCVVTALGLSLWLSGCAKGSTPTPTPSPYPRTSNVVVTATSGNLIHTVTFTLTER